MPLTKQSLDTYTRRLRLTFEGVDGDLNIAYHVRRVSPDWQRRAQKYTRELEARQRARDEAIRRGETPPDDDLDAEDATARMLVEVLTSWDYFENEGDAEPVPITTESIASLGWDIMLRVMRGIMREIGADPMSGPRSERPSVALTPLSMGTGESMR